MQSALEKQDEVEEKYLKRFAKNMDFLIKEIGYGVNFLSPQDEAKFKNLCKIYKFNKNLAQKLIKEPIAESNIESTKDLMPQGKEISKDLNQSTQIPQKSQDSLDKNVLDSTQNQSAALKQTMQRKDSNISRGDIE